MNLLAKRRQAKRAGEPYIGPTTWCDDYGLVARPGFYALSEDGKHVLPDVPLVCVDDAPGNPDDGRHHFEYAGPGDYPQRSGGKPLERKGATDLEVDATGKGGIAA